MTEKEYNYLKRFEPNFKTAEESGYTRNISRLHRKTIKAIAEKETGKEFSKNIYCNECLVDLLLTVKKHYDKYKSKQSKKVNTNGKT